MLVLFNTAFLPFALYDEIFSLLFLRYVFVLRWACHIRLSFSLSADAFQLLSRCWTVSTIVSIEFELRKLSSSNPSFCSCCDPTQHRWSPTELVSFGQNGTTLSFRQYDPYALKWLTNTILVLHTYTTKNKTKRSKCGYGYFIGVCWPIGMSKPAVWR